jgi:uncharacterized OB-fold protein
MATVDEATDSELFESFAGVQLDHVNKHFYRGLLQRELRLNRCDDCGWWHHRPKPRCPRCLSKNVTPTSVGGRGTIYMLMFLHQGPSADGVDYRTPHPVLTVELDEQEGLRFTTAGVSPDDGEISIGDRVELDWIVRAGHPFPVWRPVIDAAGRRP